MAFDGLKSFAALLHKEGELTRISSFVDPDLEITEVTDRISKLGGGGKALLFENNGTRFPLLINALGSGRRISMALGRDDLQSAGREINDLFHGLTSTKGGWMDKARMIPRLRRIASWMPKKRKGRGKCQEVVMDPPDLSQLPILKCWPADGGRFITLPAVHTVDPENGAVNTGMYRMQVLGKDMTGMHWHRHKTGAVHFEKYKKSGRRMPVTVTLGGDPAYIYAATAPVPENTDEYLLAGFLRGKKVRLVKCLTNDLSVPEDADFVIEGYVDPDEKPVMEGPFGDHTGFYSLAGYYPCFHVTCITHRKDAVYPATIVGIPPMEDAWIGKATERIFLTPLRLTMIPELVDMELPYAGVAHNLSVVKIRKRYPGQAVKVMNALWGAGQMMFNKILIVVDDSGNGTPEEDPIKTSAPPESSYLAKTDGCLPATAGIHDYAILAGIFRDCFDPGYSLHFSKGPLDILDHSSREFSFGSKLGIDLTPPFPEELGQREVTSPLQPDPGNPGCHDMRFVTGTRSLWTDYLLPVLILTVEKGEGFSRQDLARELINKKELAGYKVILIFDKGAPLNCLFSLAWLLGGNMDPARDLMVLESGDGTKITLADGTIKTPRHDGFRRDWPNVVTMNDQTIATIDKKWPELGLGDFLPSPSLKFKNLVRGFGAVRDPHD